MIITGAMAAMNIVMVTGQLHDPIIIICRATGNTVVMDTTGTEENGINK
jgi:hypothetical protein